jgi:hypothetical protein
VLDDAIPPGKARRVAITNSDIQDSLIWHNFGLPYEVGDLQLPL